MLPLLVKLLLMVTVLAACTCPRLSTLLPINCKLPLETSAPVFCKTPLLLRTKSPLPRWINCPPLLLILFNDSDQFCANEAKVPLLLFIELVAKVSELLALLVASTVPLILLKASALRLTVAPLIRPLLLLMVPLLVNSMVCACMAPALLLSAFAVKLSWLFAAIVPLLLLILPAVTNALPLAKIMPLLLFKLPVGSSVNAPAATIVPLLLFTAPLMFVLILPPDSIRPPIELNPVVFNCCEPCEEISPALLSMLPVFIFKLPLLWIKPALLLNSPLWLMVNVPVPWCLIWPLLLVKLVTWLKFNSLPRDSIIPPPVLFKLLTSSTNALLLVLFPKIKPALFSRLSAVIVKALACKIPPLFVNWSIVKLTVLATIKACIPLYSSLVKLFNANEIKPELAIVPPLLLSWSKPVNCKLPLPWWTIDPLWLVKLLPAICMVLALVANKPPLLLIMPLDFIW